MQFITVAKAQGDPDSHIHTSGECSDLTSPILRCSALVPAASCWVWAQTWASFKVWHELWQGMGLIVQLGHLQERSWSSSTSILREKIGYKCEHSPHLAQNTLSWSSSLHQSHINGKPWEVLNMSVKVEQQVFQQLFSRHKSLLCPCIGGRGIGAAKSTASFLLMFHS